MHIVLTPEQETRIQSHLAARGFASIEEAAQRLLDEKLTELESSGDDLVWAKPYVDEARSAVARGEYVTLDEHRANMTAFLATLKD